MKQVPYLEPPNIKYYHTKFSHPGHLAPRICASLFQPAFYLGTIKTFLKNQTGHHAVATCHYAKHNFISISWRTYLSASSPVVTPPGCISSVFAVTSTSDSSNATDESPPMVFAATNPAP